MTLHPVDVVTTLRAEGAEELEFPTRRFELVERIDHPYQATIELLSDDLDLDVRAFVGARAAVELERPGVTSRVLHGVVTRSEYVTTHNRKLKMRVVVEPSLALLRFSKRRRVFADRTLLEILETVAGPVFATHGGAWDASRILGQCGPWDYVVQYDETDLEFVLRLLSESGVCLLYGLGEGEGEASFVLVDGNGALPSFVLDPSVQAESPPWAVPLIPNAEEEADEVSVQYLGRRDSMHARRASVAARDWKTPGGTRFETSVALGEGAGRAGCVWGYHPGRLDEGTGSEGGHVDETKAWAARVLEEEQGGGVEVSGASNIADFTAGATFELQRHPHVELDQRYALLSVVHQADFPESELESGSNAPTYTNRFVAAPLDAGPVRPPLLPKPRASGIESATVVGPDGDDIHTDAIGRVQVRFHWDDAPSQTCWLRVMSPWAGPGYGASYIPRVGMEVVVGFLGGDPDRPVVTGCLYTGTNTPPGALPESKTCTTLRTQSTPGGDGHNELRFEDAAGREEVYLRAQRNQRTLVRAAQSTRVGASRSLSVGRDSTRTIGGSETVSIGGGDGEEPGSLDVQVAGGETRTVQKGHELTAETGLWKLAKTLEVDAGEEVRMSCDETGSVLTMRPKTTTLEAREKIEFIVGKTTLTLTPDGIDLRAAKITAKADDQVWIAAPAGRLSCNRKEAELAGGAGRESLVRLRADALEHKAKNLLRQKGKSVVVVAQELVSLEGATARLTGSRTATVTGKSVGVTGASVDVHSEGLVDVRGTPIQLNC